MSSDNIPYIVGSDAPTEPVFESFEQLLLCIVEASVPAVTPEFLLQNIGIISYRIYPLLPIVYIHLNNINNFGKS